MDELWGRERIERIPYVVVDAILCAPCAGDGWSFDWDASFDDQKRDCIECALTGIVAIPYSEVDDG